MEWVSPHAKGSLLRLHIQPGASKNQIIGLHGDRLKVKIKAPPVDGEANKALVEFMASVLEISRSRLEILRGQTSRQKDLWVELSPQVVNEVILKLF